MNIRPFGSRGILLTVMCCVTVSFATASVGQDNDMAGSPSARGQQTSGNGQQPGQAPTISPEEDAAYKAFHAVNARDSKKKIQLGKQFLEKYPKSSYTGAVYDQMVKAYYLTQNWDNFFA